MKRKLFTLLCLAVSLLTWAQGSSLSGTGSGTEADPYRIYNVYQLAQLSNYQGQSGVYFELMNDIDLAEFIQENNPTEGWEPVGTSETPFKGILKGKNHKITGLLISRSSSDNIGLFGYLEGATISDLTITGSSVKGQNNVGVFCGYAKSSIISNCSVTMSASVGVSGTSSVGGFAGGMESSTLTTCNSSSSVKGTSSYVGGFAGKATSTCSLTGSSITGDVTGGECTGGGMGCYVGNLTNITVTGNVVGGSTTGGLVGKGTGTYNQITVTGTVQGTSTTGGIAGFMSGTIKNATNEGNVTGRNNTGGIIGQGNSVTLTDVTAKGNVINASYSYIGGVAGRILGTCSFTRVSHTGDIEGKLYVSGGVGYISDGNASTFTDVHTRGTITNTGNYTGGVIAYAVNGGVGNMTNCSHFGDISGVDYVGGIIGQMNTESATTPTLSEYYISTGQSYNTNYRGPFYDTLVVGTTQLYAIKNCTNTGNISGKNNVGGLIGWSNNSIYNYSSSEKIIDVSVSSTAYNYMFKDGTYVKELDKTSTSGGIQLGLPTIEYARNNVAFNLSNNYYSGNVNGETNVGGLIGSQTSGSITNCYANGSVTGTSKVGGIVGVALGSTHGAIVDKISLSSNVAILSSIKSSDSNAGRIYGALDNEYVTFGTLGTNSSNRALTTCNLVKNGVARTITTNNQNGNSVGQTMLRLKANYVSWGWDFDNDWVILETESYPYKKYQAAPPYLEQSLVSQATTIAGKSVNGGIVTMIYRDNAAVTYDCGTGHDFSFTTQPLQSGSQVQMFADVKGMVPSYYSTANVKFAGSGTEEDPYRIYTAEDLHLMPGAGYFKIMNDIDLASWITANSPTTGWAPVGGNNSLPTYIDGNNCTISGLWINSTSNYVGLFCNFLGGYIKDLTVKVASGKKVKGADYTGILIGNMSDGTITNCNIDGAVEGTAHVGGVIGNLSTGELSKNTVKTTVTSSTASACVGGLAGSVSSVISNKNNATVTVTTTGNSSNIGGLLGSSSEGSITKNKVDANITASGTENQIGGISGNTTSEISLCHVAGTVKGSGTDSYVGGIAGYTTTPIANCYTTATITGTLYTAGIAGYTFSSIDKCYMSGNIYGGRWAAGIVGYLDGANASVTNSTVTSNILSVTHEQAWACRIIGGFKNGAAEPDNSNYALSTMQVSVNNVPKQVIDNQVEGIAKTEAELKSAALYTGLGWDMTNTWVINEGTAYPYLRCFEQTQTPESTVLVTGISLDKTSSSLAVNETLQLNATVTPTNATNKAVNWTSSNPDICSVSTSGLVTALAKGSAVITAASADGSNKTATCNVTVTEQTPTVSQDNAMGISAVSTSAGSQVVLPITLTNSVDIIAYQFELKLPEGITVAVDEDEDPIITVGSRTTAKKHGFSTRFVDSQTLCVVCTSQSNAAFSGNEGVVCNVTLNVDESLINGDYTVKLKNVSLSDSQSNDVTCDSVSGTVTVLNDYFTLSPVSGRTGKMFELPVTMVNKSQIIGFQFEIELPSGISVATDEDDDYIITLGSRSTKHAFSSSKVNDNTVRFVCTSGSNAVFSGNDGVICNVGLIANKSIEAGTYDIKLKNIALSNTASIDIPVADVATTVDITTFIPGDVNNDTKISVADVTATISFILGTELSHFIKEAADMDGNGVIKVNDATAVTSLVLNGGTSSTAKSVYANGPLAESTMHIEPMAIAAGEEGVIKISLDNPANNIIGAQFDLCLPYGLTVVSDEDGAVACLSGRSNGHVVASRQQEDGAYRFVVTSMNNNCFAGTTGKLLSIKVKASDAMAEGEYAVNAKNISLANNNSGCIDLTEAVNYVKVSDNATGIVDIDTDTTLQSIYTLDGIKQNKTGKTGLYIINGKKTLINNKK